MIKPFPFTCPVVAVPVTIDRETLTYSGMGSSAVFTQYDYSCSREGDCEHRTTAACRVRQLNS